MSRSPEAGSALPEPTGIVPETVSFYKRTPEFTEDSVPPALLRAHSTKEGVWGRIQVTQGELVYWIVDPRRAKRQTVLRPEDAGVVEPTILHEVQPSTGTAFFVEFLR